MIDQRLDTFWGAGDYSTLVRLKFPSPITIGAVRIASYATPAGAVETYKITGWNGAVPTPMATKALAVSTPTPPTEWLPPIEVARGSYDAISIEVSGPSWVAIGEIAVGDSVAACGP